MVSKKRPLVPDWESLRHFLEARRSPSLTAAARKLGVDHTTVSRRITALEESFGTRLFDRTARGWEPTPAGEKLLADAARVEEAILALERGLDVSADERGTVRVAATQQIATDVIVPAIPALRLRHPGLVLELVADNRTQSLNRREADLALRLERPRDPELVVRKLGELAHAFYARRAGRASGALEPGEPFVGYEESLSHLEHERWLDRELPARRVVFRTNTLTCLVAAVRAGVGVTLLPCFVGDPDASLVRLSTPLAPGPRELWLAVHGELRRSARIRIVMEWLAEHTASMRASFAGELR